MTWSVCGLYLISFFSVLFAYGAGVNFIMEQEVRNHRATMMLMAAALAAPLVQRAISSTLHGPADLTATSTWLLASSGRRGLVDWLAWCDALSCALAFSITYGLALYFGTGTDAYQGDVARGSSASNQGGQEANEHIVEEEQHKAMEGKPLATSEAPSSSAAKDHANRRVEHRAAAVGELKRD